MFLKNITICKDIYIYNIDVLNKIIIINHHISRY